MQFKEKNQINVWACLLLVTVIGMLLPSFAAAAPKVGSTLANAIAGGEYRIGPEDVLGISVWKEEGLDRDVLVRPDGGISFPLAGDIIAGGKTARELQTDIANRLRKFIPDALVTVSVKKVSGLRVYVLGKVKSPGQFVVGRYIDVVQALTLAGGLTPYASENGIRVIRRSGSKEIVYPFRYSDIKSGRNLKQNILLQSGDVVVVP